MKARHSRETSPHFPPNNTRLTIGLLIRNLNEWNYQLGWLGVVDAVRECNANLICFPGGALHSPEGFEAQANIIYDLIDGEHFDGLLVKTGNITLYLSPEETLEFHTRYQAVPIVYPLSVANQITSIAHENHKEIPHILSPLFKKGSYPTAVPQLVTHLIEEHGYRRIAFIRGPKGHSASQLRYRNYIATLVRYDIPFDPNLVVDACQEWLDPTEVRHFLNQRNLKEQRDFDAIIGANDERALIMIKELQARGVRVPDDVAVVGIDDRPEARMADPPLTTVRTPFYGSGWAHAERLFAHLRGEPPRRVNLPVELALRRSCGCLPSTITLAAKRQDSGEYAETLATLLSSRRATVVAEIVRVVEAPSPETASSWAEELFTSLIAELSDNVDDSTDTSVGTFILTLERILRQVAASDHAILPWQNTVSVLRATVLSHCADREILLRMEDLWGQARACVHEIAQWNAVKQCHTIEQQAALLHDIGAMLITTFDVPGLMDVLYRELPRLDIPSCYLFLYDDDGSPPEWSRLMLAYNETGRIELEPGGRRVRSCCMLPGSIVLQESVCSMVAEPLYFRTEQIGIIVFGVGPRDGSVYGILSRQISSALKGALLVQQQQALLAEAQHARQLADDANQAKSTFLANMSHELRTPLNAILGYARLLTHTPHTSEEIDYLGIIQRSGEHLLTLINQVLDLSKIEAGRITLNSRDFNLHGFLNDIRDMFQLRADEKHLDLLFEQDETVPRFVRTDEVKLRQVLINLLNNAMKFTEEGGVTVKVTSHQSPVTSHQTAHCPLPTAHLFFEVSDTGPGIAPEEIDKVFETFGQTETGRKAQEGTGLGLPISRKFVQLMGGDMQVKSEVGKGTVFNFDIQVHVVGAVEMASHSLTRRVVVVESGQRSADGGPIEDGPYRILIVDDHAINRQLVAKLLLDLDPTFSGFELREAANGQEALELWETWKPHLIWMDIRMPVMDGYEATKRIRKLEARNSKLETSDSQFPVSSFQFQTKIIALTASSLEEEQVMTLDAGCDDYLRKPFREIEMFDLLHKHLGVRFVYEENNMETESKEQGADQKVLTPEALRMLPADWLTRVHDATERADGDEIFGLLEQICPDHAPLAEAIADLVNEFAFDELVELISLSNTTGEEHIV